MIASPMIYGASAAAAQQAAANAAARATMQALQQAQSTVAVRQGPHDWPMPKPRDKEMDELLGIRVTPVPLFHVGPDEVLVVDDHHAQFSQGLDWNRKWFLDTARYSLSESVVKFIEHAKANPNTSFYVTPVGCGSPGCRGTYTPEEMATLFFGYCYTMPENVWLPVEFWENRKLRYPKWSPEPKEEAVVDLIGPASLQSYTGLNAIPSPIIGLQSLAKALNQSNPYSSMATQSPHQMPRKYQLSDIVQVECSYDVGQCGTRYRVVFDNGDERCNYTPDGWGGQHMDVNGTMLPEDFVRYILSEDRP